MTLKTVHLSDSIKWGDTCRVKLFVSAFTFVGEIPKQNIHAAAMCPIQGFYYLKSLFRFSDTFSSAQLSEMAPTMLNKDHLVPLKDYDTNNNSFKTGSDHGICSVRVKLRACCFLLILELSHSQKTSKNSLNQDEKVEVAHRDYPADLPGPEYKMELVWRNIIIFIFLHAGAVYGYFTPKNSWATIVFSKFQCHSFWCAMTHNKRELPQIINSYQISCNDKIFNSESVALQYLGSVLRDTFKFKLINLARCEFVKLTKNKDD